MSSSSDPVLASMSSLAADYDRRRLKLTVRTLLATLLYYTGLLTLLRLLRPRAQRNFVILMYHRVHDQGYGYTSRPVTRRHFARQVRYLRRHFEVLSLDELCARLRSGSAPARDCVALTFDDGYRDNYTDAFPLLRDFHMPALVYLTTGFIGTERAFWWDRVSRLALALAGKRPALELPESLFPAEVRAALDRLFIAPKRQRGKWVAVLERLLKKMPDGDQKRLVEDLERRAARWLEGTPPAPRALNWDEAREMAQQGISFGGHTVTHAILTRVAPAEARHEIEECQAEIRRQLGRPATQFAYPNGGPADYNAEIKKILGEAGFTHAVVAQPGRLGPGSDPYALGRVAVNDCSQANFVFQMTRLKDIWRAWKHSRA
jgi:peptidoglycan/xylan/chitin deacetylase (PgdA/CDA1 family)